MATIDLRSDTVTRPTGGMLEAMMGAKVGDDVYAEDPTVNVLEERVAAMLGKERALFVPTGVMSNQLCLKALTHPGDEVIVGESSHIFNYETGAPALLSGIQLHTTADPAGVMSLEAIDQSVREEAYYLPRTAVIALEQTHNREGGAIIPLETVDAIAEYGRSRGISLHMDGARIWNASVASGVPPSDYVKGFDTVSVCLSKGLGAPIGSVMVGSARSVEIAHRFRKIWGGGWRQAGILAAAGLYALDNNIRRLSEDHDKAHAFASLLSKIPGIELRGMPDTNIVIFGVSGWETSEFARQLSGEGLLISAAFKGKLRAVFHMDVTREQAAAAADIIRHAVSVTTH